MKLLPYVEQTARYDQIYKNLMMPDDDGAVEFKGVVNCFCCPSDGNSTQPSDSGAGGAAATQGLPGHSRIGIMACFGDNFGGTQEWSTNGINRGVFRGPMHKWTNFGAITDGTSNTVAFSEAVTYSTMSGSDVKGNIAVIVGGTSISDGDFGNNKWTRIDQCLAVLDPNNRKRFTGDHAEDKFNCRGWDWRAAPPQNIFSTVLPPNSPSCSEHIQPKYGQVLMAATSNHTGGVNLSMSDGSVHFVSDTIDYGNNSTRVDGVKSGASSFGVWGAMGSADGGESKAGL
ncbi:MAG: DUF1559 domain-containing protein [Planctomycetaceae bacterium]|nr:DUF1559 domain-containing protein [Planctomycetaceae bacterium]